MKQNKNKGDQDNTFENELSLNPSMLYTEII